MARLEAQHKRKAELVKLRFFAALINEQAAQALGISASTADNDWALPTPCCAFDNAWLSPSAFWRIGFFLDMNMKLEDFKATFI